MAINEFKSESYNLGSDQQRAYEVSTTTTDATPSVIGSVAVPTDHSALIEARITGLRQSGAGSALDSAYYIVRARAVNVAGTVSIYHILKEESEDLQAWDADLVVNGSKIDVQVTGAGSTTILFRGIINYKYSENP